MLATFMSLIFVNERRSWAAVNIPVGSTVYSDLERLEVKGLLKSSILSTRPFSRLEGLRLLNEAERNAGAECEARRHAGYDGGTETKDMGCDSGGAQPLGRLRKRLGKYEADENAGSYLKPVEKIYARFVYSDGEPHPLNINNRGDKFSDSSNLRAGFEMSGRFLSAFSFYLNPEYRLDAVDTHAELTQGYATADISNIEVLAGKDSMWWGPGYHGSLIMSNNAEPLEMVKITLRHPFILPWVFSHAGLLKPTVFLARLEEERDYPGANLLGMRVDFKPTTSFGMGLSRVFLFGGEGRASIEASDWADVFFASDSAEHSGSSTDGDQIVSLDASYVYVGRHKWLPFSGLKLYAEIGAEDSSGETKTPTGRAYIYGAFIDEPFWLRDADIRFEWADTARSERYGPQWYRHGIYTSGYTYKGSVIGHHMGGDARDLFVRLQYHGVLGADIGIEGDIERSGVHGDRTERKWLGIDFTFDGTYAAVSAGFGIYDTSESGEDGQAVWIKASMDF